MMLVLKTINLILMTVLLEERLGSNPNTHITVVVIIMRYIYKHPAYQYALDVTKDKIIANQEIKLVCQQFINDLHDKDSSYWFDEGLLWQITQLFKIIRFGDGFQQGQPVGKGLIGFQWFFIASILCWKQAKDHSKRRYTKGVMLIARKNGKTFLVGLIFLLLLLTEPPHSNFYSVAPDLALSSIVKMEIQNLLDNSPVLVNKFSETKKKIMCNVTKSNFQPLATSRNRMDGRQAGVFLADEVGALKNNYPISAMQSSQLTVHNPLGVLISTAYPTLHNPMRDEVQAASKTILDPTKRSKSHEFALLYKPDNPREWKSSDKELLKPNPLAQAVPTIAQKIKDFRSEALAMPSKRSNFLTKHMNIFVDGDAGEQFVTETELNQAQLTQPYNWNGADVYVGFDLSQTNDNTAVSMVTLDRDHHNTFVAKSWAFYPIERQIQKKRVEHIDYAKMDRLGYSFGCGSRTIDYAFIEKFILGLQNKYGVNIKGIGYDKWNAMSTVGRLKYHGFDMYEVPQNARGLYPGTKRLREAIEDGNFAFDQNDLLKQNFLNAAMVKDMNLSYYLNKKKSDGKIDMAAATVNCMALWDRVLDDEANNYAATITFI